jgi:hypothetical protein
VKTYREAVRERIACRASSFACLDSPASRLLNIDA